MKSSALQPVVAALLGVGYSSIAAASGFALIDQSSSSAGNSYAGAAALAEDASTVFFNPAGLTYLKGSQLVLGAHVISIDAHFRKSSATSAVGSPLTGGEGGNIGGVAAVPSFYYARELSPQLSFGLGVNAPFGLKTEYDADWVGRYQATLSSLKSANINPSLAWKVSDTVSIGGGIDMQYFAAELVKSIDFGSVCFGALGAAAPGVCGPLGFLPQAKDGQVSLKGNTWSYGWNIGALFQLSNETRLGIAYRAKIKHTIKGDVVFTKPTGLPGPIAANPSFTDGKATARVTAPEFLEMSLVSQLDPKLTIMGDITWNHWSSFQELRVVFENGAPPSVTPENWRNSYRFAIGANYQLNDSWKLRTGVAYEESGIQDAFRTAVLPDNNRRWLSFGANYRMSKENSIDMSFTHGFIGNSSINHSDPPVAGTIVGSFKNNVDIFSVQFNHQF